MHSICPGENLIFFLPKKYASFSDLEEKDFRLSVKMPFGALVKTAFNLSRKKFFKKKVLFKSFSLFNEMFSAFYSNIFSKFVRTAFSVSRGTSCEFFAVKKPINFGHYQHYGEIFPVSLTKLNSKCAREFFKEFDSAKKNFFFHGFRTLGETNETFWGNIFSRVVKTASSGSGETLWMSTFLEEVNFYYHFGTLREIMSPLWRKIFHRVSEVAFHVSRETFWSVF